MNAEAATGTEQVAQAQTQGVAPAEGAPQTPKTDDRVSQKLQVLVQREKRALEIEQRAKQSHEAAEQRAKSIADREAKITEFENLKKSNPLKALELLGLSYQDLTGIALNDGNIPPELQVKKVEEKLDSYVKAQEAAKLELAEQAKKQAADQEAKVIEDFKGSISSLIDSDPKKYEAIRFEGLQDYVFHTIEEHFLRTNEVMSISDAADKVETAIRKKYEDARKLEFLKTKEVPPLMQNVVKQQTFTPRPQQRTLTNKLSATPLPKPTRPMSDEEKVRIAIANVMGRRT
jgi:hypothetical protein